jgi:hypothetical protein
MRHAFQLVRGVNNHFQSVLYNGVLMCDENNESFEWVFLRICEDDVRGKDQSQFLQVRRYNF